MSDKDELFLYLSKISYQTGVIKQIV